MAGIWPLSFSFLESGDVKPRSAGFEVIFSAQSAFFGINGESNNQDLITCAINGMFFALK